MWYLIGWDFVLGNRKVFGVGCVRLFLGDHDAFLLELAFGGGQRSLALLHALHEAAQVAIDRSHVRLVDETESEMRRE